MNTLPVYDSRYTKTQIRTYGDEFYNNFPGLNVPEDGVECEPFAIISIDSFLVYENKSYLSVYLDNYVYKILNINRVWVWKKNSFLILINGSHKCCITKVLI